MANTFNLLHSKVPRYFTDQRFPVHRGWSHFRPGRHIGVEFERSGSGTLVRVVVEPHPRP